jgi:hypothetical protein
MASAFHRCIVVRKWCQKKLDALSGGEGRFVWEQGGEPKADGKSDGSGGSDVEATEFDQGNNDEEDVSAADLMAVEEKDEETDDEEH